jgi:DNA-binding response OmpR family regulator
MNKILIIEDEQTIRESMAEFLQMSNYEVQCAENGEIGIEKALKFRPDIVICDVQMSVLNGWETLSGFKETINLQGIPFVFLTAKSTMDDLKKGMDLGANDYLKKPFDPIELLYIIAMQLKNLRNNTKLIKIM